MNCIQQRNPLAGFIHQHSIFCVYCEEEATKHFNTGYACGNVCESCGRKRFRLVQIEDGRYVEEKGER